MKHIPYTYLIGWKSLNRWYYGVEYKSANAIANPLNLFDKESPHPYFTSSKEVKYMIKQFGNPDHIEIRRTFNCPIKAVEWEQRVLKRMKVVEDEKWINKSYHNHFFGRKGKPNTPEHNAKISKAHKGRKQTEEHKRKAVENRRKNGGYDSSWLKGLTKETDERVAKLAAPGQPGKKRSEECKRKISLANKGRISKRKGISNTKISGAVNCMAKSVKIGDIIYPTLTEARKQTGLTHNQVRKFLVADNCSSKEESNV